MPKCTCGAEDEFMAKLEKLGSGKGTAFICGACNPASEVEIKSSEPLLTGPIMDGWYFRDGILVPGFSPNLNGL